MSTTPTEKPMWNCGVLKERMGPLPAGQVVFYRPATIRLAAGPCWWVRPQGIDHFWMVSELYGGPSMCQLIKPSRTTGGKPLLSPPERASELESMLKSYTRKLPKAALPSRKHPHEHRKQPLRFTSSLA